jgi:hypothetical protein
MFSQECKMVKNEIDPFTKATTKITAKKVIALHFIGESIDGQLKSVSQNGNTQYSLLLDVTNSKESPFSFKKGNKLYFKLENDSVIVLKCEFDKDKMFYEGTFTKSLWHIQNEYLISKNELDLFKNNLIKQIRFVYFNTEKGEEVYIEYDKPSTVSADNMKKLSKCVD